MQTTGEQFSSDRVDEEDIRLTTGFADVFTAILLVVGFIALNALAGVFGCVIMVLACFALGRSFIRDRQFATTGIVLAIGVAVGAAVPLSGLIGVGGLLLSAGASLLYWRTFKVPISLAFAWVAAIAFPFALLGMTFSVEQASGLALVAGILTFAVAMYYDAGDRVRQTRRSDVAFWLHFSAAPILVHGLFSVMGVNPWAGTPVDAWIVLAVFLALTIIALVIDRRPILVSSFVYVLAATGSLLSSLYDAGNIDSRIQGVMLAPGIIGLLMLLLAAAWTPIRRGLLWVLPEVIIRYVPAAGSICGPREDRADLPTEEKEPLRLVLGFNDIFVAMGAKALFIGSIFVGWRIGFAGLDFASITSSRDLFMTWRVWTPVLLPAASLWLVAEYFVRHRRMAWPAISIAMVFSWTSLAAGLLLAFIRASSIIYPASLSIREEALPPGLVFQCVLIVCLVGLAANLLFWWRHRVPLSFALAVGSLLPLLFVDVIGDRILEGNGLAGDTNWQVRMLVGGLMIFAAAMAWDRADPARQSQRSDTAFWLHLLSSFIVIPVVASLAMGMPGGAFIVMLVFAGLVVLALVIDRRAPLVVALPFVVGAVGPLLGGLGSSIVGLALSTALLALVLRWDVVRNYLMALMPGPSQQPS
ncbi:MAG: hypothetical protein ABI668_10945 [Sphingorhabdus sp.]